MGFQVGLLVKTTKPRETTLSPRWEYSGASMPCVFYFQYRGASEKA